MNVNDLRQEDGTFESYAWPGGYQILYQAEDGGILCPECVNTEDLVYTEPANGKGWDDPQWHLVGYFVNWEGPAEQCDHCGTVFDSEYGEPEEDAS